MPRPPKKTKYGVPLIRKPNKAKQAVKSKQQKQNRGAQWIARKRLSQLSQQSNLSMSKSSTQSPAQPLRCPAPSDNAMRQAFFINTIPSPRPPRPPQIITTPPPSTRRAWSSVAPQAVTAPPAAVHVSTTAKLSEANMNDTVVAPPSVAAAITPAAGALLGTPSAVSYNRLVDTSAADVAAVTATRAGNAGTRANPDSEDDCDAGGKIGACFLLQRRKELATVTPRTNTRQRHPDGRRRPQDLDVDHGALVGLATRPAILSPLATNSRYRSDKNSHTPSSFQIQATVTRRGISTSKRPVDVMDESDTEGDVTDNNDNSSATGDGPRRGSRKKRKTRKARALGPNYIPIKGIGYTDSPVTPEPTPTPEPPVVLRRSKRLALLNQKDHEEQAEEKQEEKEEANEDKGEGEHQDQESGTSSWSHIDSDSNDFVGVGNDDNTIATVGSNGTDSNSLDANSVDSVIIGGNDHGSTNIATDGLDDNNGSPDGGVRDVVGVDASQEEEHPATAPDVPVGDTTPIPVPSLSKCFAAIRENRDPGVATCGEHPLVSLSTVSVAEIVIVSLFVSFRLRWWCLLCLLCLQRRLCLPFTRFVRRVLDSSFIQAVASEVAVLLCVF